MFKELGKNRGRRRESYMGGCCKGVFCDDLHAEEGRGASSATEIWGLR